MKFNLENLEAERILQEIIHTAAKSAPYGTGNIITYVVDTVFFPAPEVDLWKEMEGKVSALVDARLDQVVNSLANNSAAALLARLKAMGSQLKQIAYVTDREERKVRVAFLLTQIESAVAECVALPNAHLLAIPDVLRPLALAHVAVLFEQKALEPHRYEHQSALNHAAIMYSDLAGSLFQRAMAWRLGMIADSNGTLVMTDLNVDEVRRTHTVEIMVYDRFANDRWQPGEHGLPVIRKTVGPLPMDRVSVEFEDAKTEVYAKLTAYADDVTAKFTERWNEKLLNFTQKFMNLVDWAGLEREKKGEATRGPRALTFPIAPLRSFSRAASVLDRLDLFLEQQMDQFTVSGPRYAQTYRLPPAALAGEHGAMHTRADSYDTAVACIYFLERGNLQRARDLGDALVIAVNHDALGGGRLVAATRADELLDRGLANTTSIHPHDGARRDVGNMSWAGLALTRLYHATGQYRYLNTAECIGRCITGNWAVKDEWGGFSGGQDPWGNHLPWRSVEHNTDAFSFFANLHALTGEAHWAEASASARGLVLACRVTERRDLVYYCTGTTEKMVQNRSIVPTDTQSWTALAGIDPGANEGYSLIYMMQNMHAESAGFHGFRFSLAGTGVQNEATAGAVMALQLSRAGLQHAAGRYYDSLIAQIDRAPNANGYGVVATPLAEATTGPGLGWSYFNFPHVASTAWTGLALLAREQASANPYAPLSALRSPRETPFPLPA